MMNTTRYTVRFVNHGYSASEVFPTVTAALDFAARTGFEAAVESNGEVVAAWSVFGGRRYFSGVR